MKIDFNLNNGTLSVALDGRLDTNTAPALGSFLHEKCDAATALIINCEKLTYVSSAGLRILLATFKQMKAAKGDMALANVGENFLDVLKNTGLDAVFGI